MPLKMTVSTMTNDISREEAFNFSRDIVPTTTTSLRGV
jgi:hypothetical protein